MSKSDAALAAAIAELADEERARLPSRLRALIADDHTMAWNAAKAERDAAYEAAWAIEDLDDRAAALEAAKTAWTERKAELLAQQAEG